MLTDSSHLGCSDWDFIMQCIRIPSVLYDTMDPEIGVMASQSEVD